MVSIIIVYLIFVILFILTFRIKDKKVGILTKMSTIIYISLSKLRIRKLFKNPEVTKSIKSISEAKNNESELIALYYIKKIKIFLAVILVGNTLAFLSFISYLIDYNFVLDYRFAKNDPGKGIKKQEFMIKTDDIEEKMQIELMEYNYSEKEFKEIVNKNYSKWIDVLLGENKKLSNITSNVNLVSKFLDYPFDINYSIDDENIINNRGEINFFNITSPINIDIKALISYKEYKIDKTINLRINSAVLSEAEKLKNEILSEVDIQNKDTSLKNVNLPRSISNKKISYSKVVQNNSLIILFASIIVSILVYVNEDKRLKEKVKKRKIDLKMEYPFFLSKLAILHSAGLSVSNSIIRISSDEKNNKKTLYLELKILANQLNSGISIRQALEEFSQRIDIPEYSKLCSMLYSNIKKGGVGLSEELLLNAKNQYKDKSAFIKVKTEKAGTKLLIPMGMMLGVVLLITIIPAFTNI